MSHDNQSIDKPKKIIVENLYKIFGDLHQEVINLLEKGLTKDEILKKTDSIVGVCNANFSINDGEIFVVMGLSGSGKSTLVRLLNRLIEEFIKRGINRLQAQKSQYGVPIICIDATHEHY